MRVAVVQGSRRAPGAWGVSCAMSRYPLRCCSNCAARFGGCAVETGARQPAILSSTSFASTHASAIGDSAAMDSRRGARSAPAP